MIQYFFKVLTIAMIHLDEPECASQLMPKVLKRCEVANSTKLLIRQIPWCCGCDGPKYRVDLVSCRSRMTLDFHEHLLYPFERAENVPLRVQS